MVKRIYTAILIVFLFSGFLRAQSLSEKKDVILYEHHSPSSMNSDFGSKSGYDFKNHTYISIFDPEASSGSLAYPENSTVPNDIDMAEFMSANQNLGFTSGNSSTYGPPYIRGNHLTLFMPAPAGFDYNSVTTMMEIKNAYDESKASKTVNEAIRGRVYIVRLRNSDEYLAMKINNVQNPSDINTDRFFSFDYKYVAGITSVEEFQFKGNESLYPNPAQSKFTIDFGSVVADANVRIIDLLGREIISRSEKYVQHMYFDVQHLNSGFYFVETVIGSTRKVTRIELVR